ncbi:hypothetical protein [[Clostridium] scindens]|uniref:hypothetical protein n=1 Tax=Clostridium scindens (strain JCM 10418 / VPI 12708) TaxID=29347 RepID=UPI00242D45F3|nr:hypothetical protein [[Clostridium] scindens]
MPANSNAIALAKNYISILDEVYKNASVTADLTSDASMMRESANVNEVLYPQIEVGGLGDYDRNSGYTSAGVKLGWKTAKFNYDRGAKLEVDVMDNQESMNLAFTRAGAELQRTRVAPEADAFTFATICGFEGITLREEAFANAVDFLSALIEAKNKMDEDEVPEEGRILYTTPTLLNGVMALDTTKSREILSAFTVKKKVPQSRFYTAIDLLDGKSPSEEAGHYKKAAGAKDVNFMIIHRPAIIKFDKHVASDVIPASLNADADGDILKYRKYGLVDYNKNKAAGFYVSHKPAQA